jgi:hypothetical protein
MVDKIFERTEAEGRELTLEEVLLLSDVEDVLFELKNGNERLVNLYHPPSLFTHVPALSFSLSLSSSWAHHRTRTTARNAQFE